MMDAVKRKSRAVNCPGCNHTHKYTDIKNICVNDPGYWIIKCNSCDSAFCIPDISDINDSSIDADIVERHEGKPDNIGEPLACRILEYSVDLNQLKLSFKNDSTPLYICDCSKSLDIISYKALTNKINDVIANYGQYINLEKAVRMPDYEYLKADISFECDCKVKYTATFYKKKIDEVPGIKDFILADIKDCHLSNHIYGLYTKDDAMELLSKLLMRWNLLADQIVLASPFVGHLFKDSDGMNQLWEWILEKLDFRISMIVTKSQTWKSYKENLSESCVPIELIEEFELDNKIVKAGIKKHNFHAKFYAGFNDEWAEVLSGSANLVKGPSIENVTFARMTRETFNKKYLDMMDLDKKIPEPKIKAKNRSWSIYPELKRP